MACGAHRATVSAGARANAPNIGAWRGGAAFPAGRSGASRDRGVAGRVAYAVSRSRLAPLLQGDTRPAARR
ncbi:hypothetical protein GLE_1082 [Lysobacter enzymogenes]|uniref:Uncharacterized protein n=1 Tax=Lysobacter enzymogenes TaxID=69 RepID=A0A0S2DDP4_LYSEN|nr:hypothetical protein GLE_1082 [Lysobacter enzymogenes]